MSEKLLEMYPAPPGLTAEEWNLVLSRRHEDIYNRGYNRAVAEVTAYIENLLHAVGMQSMSKDIQEKFWRKTNE